MKLVSPIGALLAFLFIVAGVHMFRKESISVELSILAFALGVFCERESQSDDDTEEPTDDETHDESSDS